MLKRINLRFNFEKKLLGSFDIIEVVEIDYNFILNWNSIISRFLFSIARSSKV